MARYVALDNVAHQHLLFAERYGAAHGDAVNQVLALPTEFEALQRHYPILFRRDAAGRRFAVALLGLSRDANVFLRADGGWGARYIPAMRRRGPFVGGTEGEVMVDLDDPRIGEHDGEPLFLPHGGDAPMLQRIAAVLDVLRRGEAASAPMYDALDRAGVFVPAELEIETGDGQSVLIDGVERIDDRRLATLDAATLEALNRAGFLRAAYMAAASLDNVHNLLGRAR